MSRDDGKVVLKAELPPEQRKCRDKMQFNSRKGAKTYAKRRKGLGLHIYRCQYCNHWHLTRNHNNSKWDGKLAPKSHSPQNWKPE